MSEPMFPGGSSSSAAPAPAEVTESKGNRKTLLVLGAVVAALVVGGGAFLMLNSGSSSTPDDALVTPAAPANPAAPKPSASPSATPVVKPASVNVAKTDPFAPLYPAPAPSTPATAPSTAATTPATGSAPPPPVTSTPNPVTLLAVGINTKNSTANINVDSKKYTGVKVGQTFGTYYTMYSVFNDQCVGVLYGDQAVALCLGKPVSVTP